jgi:hypothetical protein
MDRQRTAACDHHHPLQHGLAVERPRLGGDRQLGLGIGGPDGGLDAVLERGDAVERERAADADDEIDELDTARLPNVRYRSRSRRCGGRGASRRCK